MKDTRKTFVCIEGLTNKMHGNVIKTWHKMQVREEERHHNFQEKEFERKINKVIETSKV